MIEIKDLSHSFGPQKVLEDVNIKVDDAQVLGLVGINGAGKSTLLRLISGVYRPQKGTVTYDGKDPVKAVAREDIFLLPDDPYYTGQTNCRSLLELYKTFYPKLNEATFKDMIKRFGLNEKKPLRSFSKGMRRQAFVALAFAVAPKYMLLDEAFDGLDPLARKYFKEQIRKFVKENKSTVIISSHSLKELDDFCDMYVMIDDYHVISSGVVLERTMDLFKYQMAFETVPTEEMFSSLDIKSIRIIGRFATIVAQGEENEILSKINELNPLIFDKIDVGFEEAFIGDVDKRVRGGEAK